MSDLPLPELTVVVPTKNRPASLERLVQSIRRQTLQGLEIVVIDDGSTEPLPALGSDVRLVRNANSHGACAARNTGWRLARGRYLAFLDDDSELSSPDTLERGLAWFKRRPSCGVVGFRQTDTAGHTRGVNPANVTRPSHAAVFFTYGCIVSVEAMHRLSGFREILGYYQEEIDFSLRLLDEGLEIIYDPDLSVVHHEAVAGRDWKLISRLSVRNGLLIALVDFPVWLVPFGLIRAVTNGTRAFKGRVGIDVVGKAAAVAQALRLTWTALGQRMPIRTATLFRYRTLLRAAQRIE